VPRHPDLIRQRSIVFLSAVVVPTAADLAATPLDEDKYTSGLEDPSTPVTAHILHKISPELLIEVADYHRRVLACLAKSTTDSQGVVQGCVSLPPAPIPVKADKAQ